MLLIEEGQILRRLEAIDIGNDEYAFRDATGSGVSIKISEKNLTSVDRCAAEFPPERGAGLICRIDRSPGNCRTERVT